VKQIKYKNKTAQNMKEKWKQEDEWTIPTQLRQEIGG
jgi:hypothetical protein